MARFVVSLLAMGKLWDALTKQHYPFAAKPKAEASPKPEGSSENASQTPTPTIKKCPFCATEIPFEATVCPQCQKGIDTGDLWSETVGEVGKGMFGCGCLMMLIPIGVILIGLVAFILYALVVG
jgi:hypothetical protein